MSRPMPPPRGERGAALLVALVLVLLSTVLGVTVMQTSGVETRLVANEAFRQGAFRAAEAAAERALLDLDSGTLAEGVGTGVAVDSVDDRVAVTAEARLDGVEHMINSSTGLFQSRLYAVSATAEIAAVDARRTVVQGAARRAPAVAP